MTDIVRGSNIGVVKLHLAHPDQRKRWHRTGGELVLHDPARGVAVTRCGRSVYRQALASSVNDPDCCGSCAHSARKWGDRQPVADTDRAFMEAV